MKINIQFKNIKTNYQNQIEIEIEKDNINDTEYIKNKMCEALKIKNKDIIEISVVEFMPIEENPTFKIVE